MVNWQNWINPNSLKSYMRCCGHYLVGYPAVTIASGDALLKTVWSAPGPVVASLAFDKTIRCAWGLAKCASCLEAAAVLMHLRLM